MTKYDAIVLLAGDHQGRAPAAAKLFQEGRGKSIILTNDGVISGWSSQYDRNLYQIEWAEEMLVKLGVPRAQIIKLPFYGSSTMYDALAVREYVRQHPLNGLILVTSDYHTRRALWTFRTAFSGEPAIELQVVPSADSVTVWTRITELCKYSYYYIRYGLLGLLPSMSTPQNLGNR